MTIVCFDGLAGKTCLSLGKEGIRRLAKRHAKDWGGRVPIRVSYELGMGFYYAVFEPKEDFVACGYDRWLCKCRDVDESTKITDTPLRDRLQVNDHQGLQ